MTSATATCAAPSPASPVIQPLPASRAESIVLYGAFSLLLFGPMAFGAVEAWSIFVMEMGAAGLFLLWAVQQVRSGELHITPNPLFPPMMAFAVLVLLQIVAGVTAYRFQTISGLQLCGAYGALCFLVVQCLRRTSQVKWLTITLSCYGFALAAFALVQGISSNGKLYWMRTPESGGWIYGPYVNHNHYAGLMELLAPIPLVFSLTHAARGRRKLLATVAAAVMASTIFLSGSRGGMAAFAVQMAVLGILAIKKQRATKAVLAAGIFLAIMAGILAWLGGGELTTRLASVHHEARTELSGGTRMDIARDGLKMFLAKPVFGWGSGAFPHVYPQFRSFYTDFYVNEAHNDYVQLLVETGAVGFAIMLWLVVTVFRKAGKKISNWADETNGAVALAATLGCTGILVHSFVDFNLQIPANAALFYVFCTIAAMEPRFGITRRSLRKHTLVAEMVSAQSG